jgi:ATP-dependent helicase/nuclease subunit A
MTVHASKGLEFPIVFVVNLAKGASGPPRPIRVIADGEGGEPSVSIGPFVSETDELERDREKHETRRLLYVALTRARDRLYLSSVVKDGVLQPGRGSLGEVLPDSLKALFARAATSFAECERLAWEGQSGHSFEWRLCRAPVASDGPATALTMEAPDWMHVGPRAGTPDPARIAVTSLFEQDAEASGSGGRSDRVVGRLAHRLFAAFDVEEPDLVAEAARRLVTPEERAGLPDLDRVINAAITHYREMKARPGLGELLRGGRCLYEVPFSMVVEGAGGPVLRGTIDCLVLRDDGTVVIVEFKTGGPRSFHQRQLDIYVSAARILFPGSQVNGLLVYSGSL